MNILVLGVQVPFTRGGAEILLDGLVVALRAAGHTADLVQLPFSALPKERILDAMLQWRALDVRSFGGKEVDLVIATKFPSYCVRHPRKILWLIHQHRQAYDLYGTGYGDFSAAPEDEALRQLITKADETSFQEAKSVYTISETVTRRLRDYVKVESTALPPPPPLAGCYRSGEKGGYILSVGRLCSIKRPDLLIRALPMIEEPLRVKVVGTADEPGYDEHFLGEITKNRVGPRVDLLGRVDDDALLSLYADAFAIYYAPHDEDYGFVTLEGLLSGKPVVTAADSGGTLAFIKNGKTGLVAEPNPQAIAHAFNSLRDEELYQRIALAGKSALELMTWDQIVTRLIAG